MSNPDLSTMSEGSFDALAALLLDGVSLIAGDMRLRLREIELYLHRPSHPDPFAHQAPEQAGSDTWYFHRAGPDAGFRGGSFKGLDITFGPADSRGGILIRTASALDTGGVISGPSLLVDRLLELTGHDRVADLHAAIDGRDVWDTASPLRLAAEHHEALPILTSPRVGLTLKRAAEHPTMPDYIDRPYRYLNAPRAIRKGRDLLVRALAAHGESPARIRALTGTTAAAIERWLGRPS